MVPEINYWAVLLATASSMAVGAIWYARGVFGTRWAKLANVDMDRPGASAVMPIVVTVMVELRHGVGARGRLDDRVALLRRRLPSGCAPHGADPVGGVHSGEVHHPQRLRGSPVVAHRAQHRARARDARRHGRHHRRLASGRHRLRRGAGGVRAITLCARAGCSGGHRARSAPIAADHTLRNATGIATTTAKIHPQPAAAGPPDRRMQSFERGVVNDSGLPAPASKPRAGPRRPREAAPARAGRVDRMALQPAHQLVVVQHGDVVRALAHRHPCAPTIATIGVTSTSMRAATDSSFEARFASGTCRVA